MFDNVGELDQKIDFNREVAQGDGMGGQSIQLKLIAPGVWAGLRPLSGKESEQFDKINATSMAYFKTRYRTDIKEDDRITFDGEQYNIRYIPKTSKRKLYTEYYAERGVAL